MAARLIFAQRMLQSPAPQIQALNFQHHQKLTSSTEAGSGPPSRTWRRAVVARVQVRRKPGHLPGTWLRTFPCVEGAGSWGFLGVNQKKIKGNRQKKGIKGNQQKNGNQRKPKKRGGGLRFWDTTLELRQLAWHDIVQENVKGKANRRRIKMLPTCCRHLFCQLVLFELPSSTISNEFPQFLGGSAPQRKRTASVCMCALHPLQ